MKTQNKQNENILYFDWDAVIPEPALIGWGIISLFSDFPKNAN